MRDRPRVDLTQLYGNPLLLRTAGRLPITTGMRKLLPPKQLGRRIQWLFLLMGLFNVVGSVPRMLGAGVAAPLERVAAIAGVVFLVVWWIGGSPP